MLRVSLRNLFMHKLRLLLTVTAVTVGVAFVSGTFVLSDTMNKAFEELYAGLTSGTDVSVRAELAYSDVSTQGTARPLDEDLVRRVAGVPGVAVAEGSVGGYALVLDKRGDPIQPGGAPTIGTSIGGDRRLAGDFSIRQGHAPTGRHEVVLDARTVKKSGYRVGDSVRVLVPAGTRTFTLVGVVGFGETDSLLGATLAGFDLSTAQQLLGKTGKVDQIDLAAEDGVTPGQLRDRVADVLPPGTEALTGSQVAAEGSEAVREGLGIFTRVLLVFAAVSLLVGSFVIWNTFSVLVAQRRRETALLRAVGATRRQVLGGVLVEAGVIGLVSAGLGLFAGVALAVGIRALIKTIGIDVPTTSPAIEPRTVLAALAVGIVVTMVAAVVPAWAATRVTPVEALREGNPVLGDVGPRRRTLGWALLGAGLLGLVACALLGNQPWWTAVATLTAFGGLVAAGPVLAIGMARLADRGRRGGGWRMAARNIARAPRRAAATALALTIGLTVVTAVAVTASSLKDSVADSVTGGNRSDLILTPAGAGIGMPPAVADRVRARPDVQTVVEIRSTGARLEGRTTSVVGIEPRGLADVVDVGVQEGRLADFVPGSMLLGVQEARDLGVTVGDRVSLTFPETGAKTLRVAALVDQVGLVGSPYLLTLQDVEANTTTQLDGAVMLTTVPGTDVGRTETQLRRALRDYPNVEVSDPQELTADAQASVDQLLGLVTALLLLAVVVAILGIVNTLVLSVVERSRELGLLRAVGATRAQLRSVVRRESVLMSLLGALTGVGLGVASGVALSRALVDDGLTRVSVPAGMLSVYLVVAVVVGVLAAIGPALRASHVDVLRAVTVE
jgi:putative ABC transport system permease protein